MSKIKYKKTEALRVRNGRNGKVLVRAGRVADRFGVRLCGLIGRKRLSGGEGLLIAPCSSIHTCFMGFAIDAVYLNRAGEVVGIDEALKPWRIGRLHRKVRYVLELPAGAARARDTRVGDSLVLEGYQW
ncbi:MAG: DUF192 domain-containing protein [Anaerolineae bacterium]